MATLFIDRYIAYACVVFSFASALDAFAAPTVPVDENEVVEHLPSRLTEPEVREIRASRARLNIDPRNVPLATSLARTLIERARRTGDPRDLGQAQAVIAPWWTAADPPPDVLLMRATLKQSTHDFGGALADLDVLLAKRPNDAQAWLTRATIFQVVGDYAGALKSCDALARITRDRVVDVCRLETQSLAGYAKEAYSLLAATVKSDALSSAPAGWVHIVLAEVADRAGLPGEAETHYRAALKNDPRDAYAKGAWADFLIDAGRYPEVIALLRDDTRNDALLLRRAIAEARSKSPAASDDVAKLRERFEAARLRGDVVHRREEARYALALENDPRRALELARANFLVQREYWDQRILLEAAQASGRSDEAQPVIAFQRDTGFADARLQR